MTDITSRYLEAAIIDQTVAGALHDKCYAFAAVVGKDGWQLGVAVANEHGYSLIEGKIFPSEGSARQWADELNRHIGLSNDLVIDIIASSMGGAAVIVR